MTAVHEVSRWPLSGRRLRVESGRLPLPPVTELGELDVQTIRRAHTLLETGHVQGKLVLRVG